MNKISEKATIGPEDVSSKPLQDYKAQNPPADSVASPDQMVLVHKWQAQGFQPPYHLITVVSFPSRTMQRHNPLGYQNAAEWARMELRRWMKDDSVWGESCRVCGTPILDHYICEDANNKRFYIGCDCVRHLHDEKLEKQADRMRKDIQNARRRERENEKWRQQQEARQLAIAKKEQEERERNGGKTDAEIKADEEAATRAAITAENEWILAPLRAAYRGDFVSSMIHSLTHGWQASNLSDGQKRTLCDIYAKWETGKSRGKVFDTAWDHASALLWPTEVN